MKKGKAKKWFNIIAPKYLGGKEIGKTLAMDKNALIGRRLVISAVEITGDLSKYYMKISFKIKKVEDDNAFVEFDGSECLRDYISRMVLHKVKRIDTVQDLVTKDGVKIRVKCLAIGRKSMTKSIEKVVRKKVEEIMKDIVKNSLLGEFVKNILNEEIKKKVLKEVRKIYPLRNFEIRKTEVFKS